MNLLPLVPNNNYNVSGERYLGYHSFENVDRKYSDFDNLSECFSHLHGRSNELNRPSRFQVIRNSQFYEGDLMKLIIEPKGSSQVIQIFTGSTQNDQKSNSFGSSNAIDYVSGNSRQSRKHNYIESSDNGTDIYNWEKELNVKRLRKDEFNENYNEYCKTEPSENSKTQKDEGKVDLIDIDDLADYFIDNKSWCKKPCDKQHDDDNESSVQLSTLEARIAVDSYSSKYDVFDYGHKKVDVEKLAIVDPNVNTINVASKCCSIKNENVGLCNIKAKKAPSGAVDSLVVNKLKVVDTCSVGLVKKSRSVGKVNGENKWKLIPIDCPLRTQINKTDINIEKCSVKDPRLRHLRR